MDVAAVLGQLRDGQVFELSMDLYQGMPHHPVHPPFLYSMVRQHGTVEHSRGVSSANDVFVCGGHSGTHVDSLGHFSRDLVLRDGHRAADVQSLQGGLRVFGMETVKSFLCRGVLLDVAAHRGEAVMAPGRAITDRDLEATAKAQGVRIEPGDAVLVRTGWINRWDAGDYFSQEGAPGVDLSGARWLADHGIALAGADNYAFEVVPDGRKPVHCFFLIEQGIHILEVANLEALGRARCHEFLFAALPLKIRGATGSPVRAVAVA
jgi:kynurenine formamidase